MTTKSRILIVDDELIVREDLRDLLEGLGYEVAGTAVTGREAIAKTIDLRPDLVLMDIKLRDKTDGIDAARSIRERCALPVVFLTAFADESTIARATTAYPYGYLTKPFSDRAVRASLEVALARHREERRVPPHASVPGVPVAAGGSACRGRAGCRWRAGCQRAGCRWQARGRWRADGVGWGRGVGHAGAAG